MRAFFAVVAVMAMCAAVGLCGTLQAPVDYKPLFAEFKQAFGRVYASEREEQARYEIFVSNMLVASAEQAVNPLAKFGVNGFSDMSAAEFAARYRSGARHFAAANATATAAAGAAGVAEKVLASSAGQAIDWRKKNAVTAVKNQGSCGSCWSFSATGNIEGQWAIKKGQLVSLSEQELVSCDTVDSACDGGLMDNAFNWLIRNRAGEIGTAASYPYVSGNGNVPACKKDLVVGAKISSSKALAKNEVTIADYLFANGPIAVAVDATSWQSYNGGVLTSCISSQLNHGVLAVGFDDNASPAYWIIKNSWGTSWGESGYIRIRKGTNACLIREYAVTSIVA